MVQVDKTMVLYLSGPMRGMEEFNYPLFNRAAELLRSEGYTVYNPVEKNGPDDDGSRPIEYYMSRDLGAITGGEVDALMMLNGWTTSEGSLLEARLAKAIGLPIFDFQTGQEIKITTHDIARFDAVRVGGAEPKGHGHPRFLQLVKDEVALHSAKNHDYASGGDPLGNFKRVSQILSLYPKLSLSNPTVVAATYMLKQLDAVLWSLSEGIEAQVEGIAPRLQDVSVYSKLMNILAS